MKKKMLILLVIAVVGGGAAYKTVLAKPKEEAPKPKVEGTVDVLSKPFLITLADRRYAKLSVGLRPGPARHVAGGGGWAWGRGRPA